MPRMFAVMSSFHHAVEGSEIAEFVEAEPPGVFAFVPGACPVEALLCRLVWVRFEASGVFIEFARGWRLISHYPDHRPTNAPTVTPNTMAA